MVKNKQKQQLRKSETLSAVPPTPERRSSRRTSRTATTPAATIGMESVSTEKVQNKRRKLHNTSIEKKSDAEENMPPSMSASNLVLKSPPQEVEPNSKGMEASEKPAALELQDPLEVSDMSGTWCYPLLINVQEKMRPRNHTVKAAFRKLQAIIDDDNSDLAKLFKETTSTVKIYVAQISELADKASFNAGDKSNDDLVHKFAHFLMEVSDLLKLCASSSHYVAAGKQFVGFLLGHIMTECRVLVLKASLRNMGLAAPDGNKAVNQQKIDAKKSIIREIFGPEAIEWMDEWMTVTTMYTALSTNKLSTELSGLVCRQSSISLANLLPSEQVKQFFTDFGLGNSNATDDIVVPHGTDDHASIKSTGNLFGRDGGPYSATAVVCGDLLASMYNSLKTQARQDPTLPRQVESWLRENHNISVNFQPTISSVPDATASDTSIPVDPAGAITTKPLSEIFSIDHLLQNRIAFEEMQEYIKATKASASKLDATDDERVAYTDWLRDVERRMETARLKEDTELDQWEMIGSGRIDIRENSQLIRYIAAGGFGMVMESIISNQGKSCKVAFKAELVSGGVGLADAVRSLHTHGRVSDFACVASLFAYHITELPELIYREGKDAAKYCLISLTELCDGTLENELGNLGNSNIEKPKSSIEIARIVCRMLLIFEKSSIIHRDIKPGNLLIKKPKSHTESPDDTPVCDMDILICDFGISKPTTKASQHTFQAGTDDFRAPEVQSGASVSIKSDVFSVGMVLFRCITGAKAPRGTGSRVSMKMAENRLKDRLPKVNAHKVWVEKLTNVVLSTLHQDPSQRPDPLKLDDDLQEVLTELEQALADTKRVIS